MSRFFAIVGPSGVGKDTILRRVARSMNMKVGISCTTRSPRLGEENGLSYWFISRDQFDMMRDEGKFVEHDEHFGNGYAFPWSEWDYCQKTGLDLIVILDVHGIEQARKVIPGIVGIFLMPGETSELRQRMQLRGDSEDAINARLERSEYEMRFASGPLFDYVVFNPNGPIGLREAVNQVEEVVKLERLGKAVV